MCVFLTRMLARANVMGGLEQAGKEGVTCGQQSRQNTLLSQSHLPETL